jgi:hypothetical protein
MHRIAGKDGGALCWMRKANHRTRNAPSLGPTRILLSLCWIGRQARISTSPSPGRRESMPSHLRTVGIADGDIIIFGSQQRHYNPTQGHTRQISPLCCNSCIASLSSDLSILPRILGPLKSKCISVPKHQYSTISLQLKASLPSRNATLTSHFPPAYSLRL